MPPEQTDPLSSHAWYSRLLEAAETLVRDVAGRVIFWNTAAESTYGYTRDEALGCLVHDLLATRFPQPLGEIEEILWRTGQWNGELVHRTKYGREVIVESRWILSSEAGKPAVVLEINTNVTERKRAHEALRLNEERFRLALRHSPVTVSSQDLDLRYTWVQNPAPPFTVDRILGKTDLELLESSADARRLSSIKQEVIRTRVGFQGEFSFTEGCETRFYEITVEPLFCEGGTLGGITSVAHDITRRRRRELELQEREESLRLSQDAANIGSWSWDITTNRTAFSDRYFQQLGIEPVNHSYHEWLALVHPEDRGRVETCVSNAMRQGTAYDIEYRVVHKTGESRWLLSKGRMYRDDQGNPIRLTGINLDITDRKLAEQDRERLAGELHAERLRLQAVIEQMPSGLALIVPPDGRMLLHNSEAERLWRHPAHKIEDRSGHGNYGAFHPDGRRFSPDEYPIVRALFEGETIHRQELRYLRGDGTWTWFTVNAAPIRDDKGAILAAVAVFHDIGDVKHIEEELQSSHARLRQALAAAEMGSWELDFLNDMVTSIGPTAALFGLPPGQHSLTVFERQIHPDDRQRIMDMVRYCIENRTPYSAEFRVKTAAGVRWLLGRGEVITNAEHRDLLVGAVIDITSRQQSEQSLRESEERAKRHLQELEAIYRNAPVGLCVIDRNMRWVRVNERIAEMNGFPVADHIGRTLNELLPELARSAPRPRHRRAHPQPRTRR